MTSTRKTLRRDLLCGIPSLMIALALLPATAAAQTREIHAEGEIIVTDTQRSRDTQIIALSETAPATVRTGPVVEAGLRDSDNSATVRATANAATATLDPGVSIGGTGSARITIQSDAVDAFGRLLILSRQSMVRAPVLAEITRPPAQTVTGDALRSRIEMDGNTASADARGNDHLATLAATGSGSAIGNSQTIDSETLVRGKVSGIVSLSAGALTASALSLEGNRQRAGATGNMADHRLAATLGGEVAGSGGGGTLVQSDGTVSGDAGSLIVQRQSAASRTTARIGVVSQAAGYLASAGDLDASTMTVDGNMLDATAQGNAALADLSVSGSEIEGAGHAAAILTAQQMTGRVRAVTVGGTQANVAGEAVASTLGASGNRVQSMATGNIADSKLGVTTGPIVTTGLVQGPVGTALVGNDGSRGTDAAFAIQTDQIAGVGQVGATQSYGAVTLSTGALTGTQIKASANAQIAQAIANDALADLAIEAPLFASNADLLLVQSSDAFVNTVIGDPQALAGVTIAPSGAIRDSVLEIGGNTVTGLSVANRGGNRLVLDAALASDAGRHPASIAGTLADGYGAAATLALSSAQKVGVPGLIQPVITSTVTGRFAVTGNGAVDGATVRIVDNIQSASATANSIDNLLAVSGADLGDAGTALSSSQFGEATLLATSTLRVVAPSPRTGASILISGNANRSTARINDAVNQLSVDAASAAHAPSGYLTTNALGGAGSEGRHVLTSTQFSRGTATSVADTMLAGWAGSIPAPIRDSSITLSGNAMIAEASANRALNAVSLGNGSGGIASSQMSNSVVSAQATGNLFLVPPGGNAGIEGSTVRVADNATLALARGNVAENNLTASGRPGGVATIESGAFPTAVTATVALVSQQVNRAGITATASGSGVAIPLNAFAMPVEQAMLSVTGNAVTATAYGNGAANSLTLTGPGQPGGAALASVQFNFAPVTAQVTGGGAAITTAGLLQSNLAITGNSVTASATGNVATNLIGTPR
jgi:hypothetical protein